LVSILGSGRINFIGNVALSQAGSFYYQPGAADLSAAGKMAAMIKSARVEMNP
jgi:hypothetical protein